VSIAGGLMDQTIITYGKENEVLLIDFMRNQRHLHKLHNDYQIILIASGIDAPKSVVKHEYNLRVIETFFGFQILKDLLLDTKSKNLYEIALNYSYEKILS